MLSFEEVYSSPEAKQDEENNAVITGEEDMTKEDFAQAVKESVLSLESLFVTTNEMILAGRFSQEAHRIACMNRDALVNGFKSAAPKTELVLESATYHDLPETLGYGARFMETLKKDIDGFKSLIVNE